MGTVYLGARDDDVFQKRVAIKIQKRGMNTDRFRNERQILARLEHPFGIAKLLNPDLAGQTPAPTVAGLQLMTPEYASPEQVCGEPVTTATDIYSLGVVPYELLTGQRPYQLTSRMPAEIARVICESVPARPSTAVTRIRERAAENPENPPPVGGTPTGKRDTASFQQRLRRELSGDLDTIILKAFNKKPARRELAASYSRVGDLLSATGGTKGALEYRRTSLALMEKLAEAEPANVDNLRQLGVAYSKLGNTLGNPNFPNVGDHRGAFDQLERSGDVFQRASAAYPQNANLRRNLAVVRNNIGDVLIALERRDEALARQQAALAIVQAQAGADPPTRQPGTTSPSASSRSPKCSTRAGSIPKPCVTTSARSSAANPATWSCASPSPWRSSAAPTRTPRLHGARPQARRARTTGPPPSATTAKRSACSRNSRRKAHRWNGRRDPGQGTRVAPSRARGALALTPQLT